MSENQSMQFDTTVISTKMKLNSPYLFKPYVSYIKTNAFSFRKVLQLRHTLIVRYFTSMEIPHLTNIDITIC